MLRSLVGSEMCIRDRLGTEPSTGRTRGATKGVTPGSIDRDVVASLSETCLLYTSDAADDLLCVDLGGSRILKKKTNKH